MIVVRSGINTNMATLNNTNRELIGISSNVIMTVDDDNQGDLYICDDEYSYVLNNATASDLVDFFAYNNRVDLSEEIIDTLMDMTFTDTIYN